MKHQKIYTIALAVTVTVFSACGPSEEEKERQEQARQDSLEQVRQQRMEQQRQDSLRKVRQDSMAMARQEENRSSTDASFSEDGRFAIQVDSWRSEQKAESQAQTWKERGYDNVSVIEHGDESTGDVWFRIRLGRLDSREQAEQLQQTLQQEYQTSSWISVI